MESPVSDEAFARAAHEMGAATLDQIEAARAAQADSAKKGVALSLGEALIQQGILTAAMRENIERRAISPPPAQGRRQLGNYKLQKKLGEGGMGAVYLAEDTMLARQVAIKILPERFSSQPEFLSRFKREAIAAGKLNHPNVVGAYAVGDEAGSHYYVMEYCTGEPLDKVLKRATVLNEELALEVVAQVCRGLHYAHQHGVIHRDIKPGNIFLTSDGTAKILDLGLSKNLAAADSSFQTVSGTALGTPHYISPEQAKGEKDVDGRTDVYSLGATLYHLVTGRTPFEGSTPAAVMMKHLSEQLPDPRDLSPDLSEGAVHVITKAMAKNRDDRYANCGGMLSDIELVQKGEEPSGAGLDALQSSVAMRRAVPSPLAGEGGHARRRVPGEGAGVRRTGERAPVGRVANPPHGTAGQAGSGTSGTRTYFIIGGAVAGVLLLLGLILAFSGDGKPETTAKGKPEQGKQPASSPTQPTTPEQPTKATPPVQPETEKGVTDAWIKSVQALPADRQVEEVVRKLKELNPGYDGQATHKVVNGQVVELAFTTERITDISPVRALMGLTNLSVGQRGQRSRLKDLSPLKGLQLTMLSIYDCPVEDLGPLKGMPLIMIVANSTLVSELSPLAGMPLKSLYIAKTNVSDLTPLRGMPLTSLWVDHTKVSDLSALRGMPLKSLGCDFVPERDAAILKSIKTLEKINDMPVAEFWAQLRCLRATLKGQDKGVWNVAFSPDGKTLASLGWGQAKLWDPETGTEKAAIPGGGGAGLAYAPDGKTVVLGDRLVELSSKKALWAFTGGKGNSSSAAFSPDGKFAALGRELGSAQVWDAATGKEVFSVGTAFPAVHAVAFSRDGKTFAVGGMQKEAGGQESGIVRLYAVGTWQPQDAVLRHPANGVHGLAFLPPDNKKLASVSYEGCIRLWDTGTWQQTMEFKERVSMTCCLAVAPDGKTMATAGYNKFVDLWDVARGERLARLTGHTEVVQGLAFSPDGKLLASASGDGTVKLWAWREALGVAETPGPGVAGGKVLISESFETLDLNRLPAGWRISGLEKSLLTIIEQPDRGKVLRVSRKAGDPPNALLQIALDPGMVNGRTIRASVMAHCPAGYTPISQPAALYWRPRLHLKLDGKVGYADCFLAEDERGWRQLLLSRRIPDATTSVLVEIGLPCVNGEAFFDDLVVELDPDPKSAPPKPAAAGNVDDPARWKNAVNLVPLIDPAKDAMLGKWQLRDGELVSTKDEVQSHQIEIPCRAPDEYDLCVEFTRVEGRGSVEPYLSRAGVAFRLVLDDTAFGFLALVPPGAIVQGFPGNATTVKRNVGLENGRRYRAIVQVRKDGVKAYLDGALITQWTPAQGKLVIPDLSRLRDQHLLGLRAFGPETVVFHKAQLLELTGKGTFTRPDDPAAKEAEKKRTDAGRGGQGEAAFEGQTAGAAQPSTWISKDTTYTASSVSQIQPSPNLLNGIGGGGVHETDFAFHTRDGDPDPHIIIDLTKTYTVDSLEIVNRKKQERERARTLTVWTGSAASGPWTEVWRATEVRPEWQVKLQTPVAARFIKIGLREPTNLHLWSVKVFGAVSTSAAPAQPDAGGRK